jgi:Putative DNA-binding domain
MAVYRNTAIHGAVEALRANYPVVEQILGAEMFEHVAVDFVSACPPLDPVLALYGAKFAEWLMHQRWIGDLPYLPDVARVERLHIISLFAADEERLPPELVAQISRLPGATLRLHPAACFAWLSTPAMSIWLAHQRPAASEIAPDWVGEGALFARPKPFTSHAARIGRAAHRLLAGVRLSETLGASMAAAAHLYPQEDCPAVFASLVNLGVFVPPARQRN